MMFQDVCCPTFFSGPELTSESVPEKNVCFQEDRVLYLLSSSSFFRGENSLGLAVAYFSAANKAVANFRLL